MVTMSVAACFKKSTNLISGKATFLGRKVTVSQILVLLDLGK